MRAEPGDKMMTYDQVTAFDGLVITKFRGTGSAKALGRWRNCLQRHLRRI